MITKKSFIFLFLIAFTANACAQNTALVFTEYGSKAYSSKSNKLYKKTLLEGGLKHADLLYTCYVKDSEDSEIDCSTFDSPRLYRIRNLAKSFKSDGFQVTLRFYVDLKDGKWRAYWQPKDIKKGFQNLEKELKEFAEFAASVKADQLMIGSECEALTQPEYKAYWEKIITAVRSVFNGTVLYAANGNINKKAKPEYTWVPFWSSLDKVGINYYPPFKGAINAKNLEAHHKKSIKKIVSFAKAQSKDLVITEVGFPLAKKGIYTPYEWRYSERDKADAGLRDLSLGLFLKTAKAQNIGGIHFWRFLPDETKLHPLGYLIDQSYLKTLKTK